MTDTPSLSGEWLREIALECAEELAKGSIDFLCIANEYDSAERADANPAREKEYAAELLLPVIERVLARVAGADRFEEGRKAGLEEAARIVASIGTDSYRWRVDVCDALRKAVELAGDTDEWKEEVCPKCGATVKTVAVEGAIPAFVQFREADRLCANRRAGRGGEIVKGVELLIIEEVISSPNFDDLGELDYTLRVAAFEQYLNRKGDPAKRRSAFAIELRTLADRCERNEYPFCVPFTG